MVCVGGWEGAKEREKGTHFPPGELQELLSAWSLHGPVIIITR